MKNKFEIPNKLKYKNINAYILAGGKSIRMQKDKAFLPIYGKFFIDVIIEELYNIFENIYIIGKSYSHPYIKGSMPDIISDKGPIGGILTALTHSKKDINFITGLDYPFIDIRVIKILAKISQNDNFSYLAYVPKLEDGIHPLFAIYNRKIIDKVKECIYQKRYMVRCIYEDTKTKYVNLLIKDVKYSDNLTEEEIKKCFYNLNTPEDYRKLFESYKI